MVTVEHTIEIDRPIDEVFAYLTDVQRLPEWQSSVTWVQPPESMAAGARVEELREFMGRRAKSTLEVDAYEPPARFALRAVEGPVRYDVDHRLQDVGGRTRMAVVGTAKVPGMLSFAARPLVKGIERQLRADLGRLKELLERPT